MAEPAFTFTDQIRPVCEIGMSDVREAEPDSWLDVSCHVHEVEIFRGRERFSDHFMPATASITFDNRTGWGDLVGAPLIVAGQTLRPARPIRIGVSGVFDDDTGESTRWLYRGWIDQATPAYDPVLHDVVTVNCIDAFGEAGQSVAPTGPEQGVNETVSARVNRVLDAVGWFPAKRKVATVSTTVQGTPLGLRAVDLMTAAADSAGGVVFGDLDGDVVLKGIDWMLYDPDDPPDGEIGNMDPGDPELEDVPVYVDPGEGTVYEPDPPPMVRPPIVQFCVREGEPDGTIVEQGDSWRIYANNGHLFYESSGRHWDMGEFTGEGCSTVYPPDDEGGPEVVDECPQGQYWDPDLETCVDEPECPDGFVWDPNFGTCVDHLPCPEGEYWNSDVGECVPGEECPEGFVWDPDLEMCVDEPPVDPPHVPSPGPGRPPADEGDPVDPTTLFTVELLGWDDRGFDELPATRIAPIPVTPGTDCLLVVLVNALSTITNSALLAPVVTGGGLDWFHHRHADQAGEGAASFIMMTQVGRDDPGTFAVAVDWATPMTTRSHIATVWKVRNAVNDYVDKFDAGLVLYATVDSNPPDEAQPGDGPQTVTMVADTPPPGFPALPRAVDITIAQSLAEESTGPFGATFDDTNGPWIIPDNVPAVMEPELLLPILAAYDDFDRLELGSDWEVIPVNIEDYVGESVNLDGSGNAYGPAAVFGSATGAVRWATPVGTGNQYIEVVVGGLKPPPGAGASYGRVWLYTQMAEDTADRVALYTFQQRSPLDTTKMNFGKEINTYEDEDGTGQIWDTAWYEYTDELVPADDPTHTFRLESDLSGAQRLFVDGELVAGTDAVGELGGPQVGPYVGFEIHSIDGVRPWVESFEAGIDEGRKTSWIAGWRQGVTYADVVFEDVNLGLDDVQSTQTALVLESAEVELFPTTPYGPITIGGATDPFNGPIDYIALFDPVTGDPILRFP